MGHVTVDTEITWAITFPSIRLELHQSGSHTPPLAHLCPAVANSMRFPMKLTTHDALHEAKTMQKVLRTTASVLISLLRSEYELIIIK